MYQCPVCTLTNLKVVAEVTLRLVQDGDDYETEDASDSHHEWGSESAMICRDCGHTARSGDFEVAPTPLTDAQYVACGGTKCPHCGSDGLRGDEVTVEAGKAYQGMSCNDCNDEWVDEYRLIGWTAG